MALPEATIRVTGAEAIVGALQRANVPKKKIEDAVRKGADATVKQLKANSPRGPTGNLQRAAAVKTVTYDSGTVVAVVGYRRAGAAAATSSGGRVAIGPDRAFHQYWIEYGTKNRKLKNGAVASNLKSFGSVGSEYFEARGNRGAWRGPVVVFRPKEGDLGTVQAQHPMQRAFDQTKDAAANAIESELAILLTASLKGASNG